jgi:hypothetical protein
MNYLPFDLETALAHPERVVTRDGRKVRELHHFKTANTNELSVVCVIEGFIQINWDKGQWCGEPTIESENDLFLLPEVKEFWVNVYEQGFGFSGEVSLTNIFVSKEAALRNLSRIHTYIKTIRITNEPE